MLRFKATAKIQLERSVEDFVYYVVAETQSLAQESARRVVERRGFKPLGVDVFLVGFVTKHKRG